MWWTASLPNNAAETVFATMKPPEPSLHARRAAAIAAAAAQPEYSAMPAEFMRGGGCFSPAAHVDTLGAADGVVRPTLAIDVHAGDLLRVAGGGFARVACVVLSPWSRGSAGLRRVGRSLLITPWHPVHLRGAWHYPAVCGAPVDDGRGATAEGRLGASPSGSPSEGGAFIAGAGVDAAAEFVDGARDASREPIIPWVVNFVLESSHVLLVDGVPCVTLGHGLQEAVAAHPFWGTASVVDALRGCEGWERGRVVLRSALQPPTMVQ